MVGRRASKRGGGKGGRESTSLGHDLARVEAVLRARRGEGTRVADCSSD